MRSIFCLLFVNFLSFGFAQNSIPKVLEKLNSKSVPYITVKELLAKENAVLLDARETKEYNVSHIKNAINVGFEKFDVKRTKLIPVDKEATIIVYCSIGVRSEKIGERLLKLGYKNVFNLYGGIFEWKHQGGKVVNNQNVETDEIHTFNKEWSVYLAKGKKVYEN
ncbi:rhodanese-like domain-containing protein [Flavobacterium sp. j3]|uniref:Rhodanese-like domain-containing protein n=1 Tax=Flavobacterium aureirubrum TaxID=3133147 RepID=A0ABU9NA65_9FLAO